MRRSGGFNSVAKRIGAGDLSKCRDGSHIAVGIGAGASPYLRAVYSNNAALTTYVYRHESSACA